MHYLSTAQDLDVLDAFYMGRSKFHYRYIFFVES